MGRLIILSGPSCAGKSPLDKALKRFYPELRNGLKPLCLYNDRAPRPGELDGIDYHFRKRDEIAALDGNDRYAVMEVRGDMQALDLEELAEDLTTTDVFFEGNPFVGSTLLVHPSLTDIDKLSVFMAPLCREELEYLNNPELGVSLPDLVTDVMRRKLLRRTRKQKGELSGPDLANIEKRASSCYSELKMAHNFQYVLPNHDGEDSENWDAFYYTLGDARKSLLSFAALLKGEAADGTEQWDAELLGE